MGSIRALDVSGIYDDDADIAALLHIAAGSQPSQITNGCKALMLAVLEDGIRSARSPVPMIRQEAQDWMENPHGRWPFAFVVLCETFGLEPRAVRRAVVRGRSRLATASTLASRPRSRPNVRRVSLLK